LEKAECARLQSYLRNLFGSPALSVAASGDDEAELRMGETALGNIIKDLDEGELSYCLSMGVARGPGHAKNAPLDDAERNRVEALLRQRLESLGLTVRPRPRKTDSAEAYVGDEFIGTLSVDEDEGLVLTVSILDIDLEDAG
jgi:hypothetical protein